LNLVDTQSRAVIFDLDGTLVHTAPDIAAILNTIFSDQDVRSFDVSEAEQLMGGGITELIRRSLERRGLGSDSSAVKQLETRFMKLYLENPVIATQAYPHAVETLAAVVKEGFVIGVCTNKAEKPARMILDRTGLAEHVKAVVGGDSGHGLKPDPAPLLACASLLGVSTRQIIYVGDSPVDVAAGRAAGARVIFATYGYGRFGERPIPSGDQINCLSALPHAMQMFG
jgi:phosphoglycolate phosphatase